jgi:hypothetical protein
LQVGVEVMGELQPDSSHAEVVREQLITVEREVALAAGVRLRA